MRPSGTSVVGIARDAGEANPGVKWRCTLCAQCCKSYVPLVLPHDVKVMQEALGRPMSTFITFYRTTDFDGTIDQSYEPQFFETIHGKLVMGLSRVDLPDGEAGCVFLKNNLCSVHPFRPLVCRGYPFQPQNENIPDGAIRLMDNPCFGKHAEDEVVDEAPVRQNYVLFLEIQNDYLSKVKAWNTDPKSATKDIEEFLSYVGLRWTQPYLEGKEE